MTTHLVIGMGEVGKAIAKVLAEKYEVSTLDINPCDIARKFDFLHICYPYNPNFVEATKAYQNAYGHEKTITVIHSTVAIGTTDKIPNAAHSPVRGVHPYLYDGIKRATKFIGTSDEDIALELEYLYATLNISSYTLTSARNSEALKLWDTTQYGWNIILQKEIYAFCQKYGLDFREVYTISNQTYNEDAEELGLHHVARPVLKYMDGPIGGHCVIPNANLMECDVTQLLISMNEKYKADE
jgi:UDP-N-acetyl-D-mannosaminuronate dehydrogenase